MSLLTCLENTLYLARYYEARKTPVRGTHLTTVCTSTLIFESLAVTVFTTSLNIKKFYILPTEYSYLLYVSQ